jgi:SAM-dependent methyltransferase
MKVPDSGMPDEPYWESLFDIDRILDWMAVDTLTGTLIEVGCGYGTFTVPLAFRFKGCLVGLDIEPEMIARTEARLSGIAGTDRILRIRDVLVDGLGAEPDSAGAVLMFNLLHFSQRPALLAEAARVLAPGGKLFIIHWRKDIITPRGPDPLIRPDPGTILNEIRQLPMKPYGEPVHLGPWHWGLILQKGDN